MEEKMIMSPLQDYNKEYNRAHFDKTKELFDELVEKSGIDVEANKQTCTKYYETEKEIAEVSKSNKKWRTLRGFMIFGTVLGFLALAISIALMVGESVEIYVGIIIAVLGVALAVAMIIVMVKKVNPMIRQLDAIIAKLKEEAQKLKDEAYAQVYPLLKLFDWDMPLKLVNQTCPIIHMDLTFDNKKFNYLQQKYGFSNNIGNDTSTYYIQSGSMVENPFFIHRTYTREMYNHVYHGQLTITWTEYYTDSNGNRRSRTRSEVLRATYTAPAPRYNMETETIYVNDAGPDLSFSRSPSGMSGATEKQIEKKIKEVSKEVKKLEAKAVKNGGNFVGVGNEEFDALFHGLDRTHEMQFRLLFTPLAQKNLLEIIKDPKPYGDDFYFVKRGCVNFIRTSHNQNSDIYCNPLSYDSFDYEIIKEKFANYNTQYFRNIYFDLAPLLSVPLYQQHMPLDISDDFIEKNNFTSFEVESVSNSFKRSTFAHPATTTDVIIKAGSTQYYKNADVVRMRGYSFVGEPRVAYIPVKGGDGYFHDVPVHWIEYIPLEQESQLVLIRTGLSRTEFWKTFSEGLGEVVKSVSDGRYIYERGILAFVADTVGVDVIEAINSYLEKKE